MANVFGLIEEVAGKHNARIRVLLYFLDHPSSEIYPFELAHRLQLPEVSVRRALQLLKRKGVLTSRPTRYRHYFRMHRGTETYG